MQFLYLTAAGLVGVGVGVGETEAAGLGDALGVTDGVGVATGVGVHLVKDRLGHSDISTTLRIYAHIRPEQKQEVADLFARAIENG